MLHYTNSRWARALWRTSFYSIVPAILKKLQKLLPSVVVLNCFISSLDPFFLMSGCSSISLKACGVSSMSLDWYFVLTVKPQNNTTRTFCFQRLCLCACFLYRIGNVLMITMFLWQRSEPINTVAADPANINESSTWDTEQLCVMLLWRLFSAFEEPSNYHLIWVSKGSTTIVTCNFVVSLMMRNVT